MRYYELLWTICDIIFATVSLLIIIIINEFHRDTSLKQNFTSNSSGDEIANVKSNNPEQCYCDLNMSKWKSGLGGAWAELYQI